MLALRCKNILTRARRTLPFASQNVKFIIPLIFTFYFLLFTFPAYATDSTPSADIKAKLEELKKEIASKAAKLKIEVDRKLRDKAYVGKVKSVSETSLTLSAASGPKIISINQDTIYESEIKGQSKFTYNNIEAEDYIAGLGDIDESGVLIAKKVILLPPQDSKPKTYLWGQVISLSSEKLATLKNKEHKNIAITLPSTHKVKNSDFVILTGSFDKNDIFDTEFVYVIPQGVILKPKKISTPSAQISTKSATTKPASR